MKYITNYIKTKGKYKTNWNKLEGERRNGTKWQIFKWGVFLHVAMALIAEKGLILLSLAFLTKILKKETILKAISYS